MRGLTIVVPGPDPARFRSALGMAAAHAALGGRTRLFLDAAAVPLLAPPQGEDEAGNGNGLPGRAELIETALTLGVHLIACQTGLALAGLTAHALDARIETGGITGLLASLEEDRLVTV